jgi:hypothetical protein
MIGDDEDDGWSPLRLIPRLAVGVISVPLVAGFIVLGAGVIVVRSLRDVIRVGLSRSRTPAREPEPVVRITRTSSAA